MWKILKENNFNEIMNDIDNDMICTMCQRIIINASCACGCRNCLECLLRCLDGNEKLFEMLQALPKKMIWSVDLKKEAVSMK